MTRVLFNDGEGIDHVDFNLQRELFLRQLFDDLLANAAGGDQVPWASNTGFGRVAEELRPLRHAGIMTTVAASTVVTVDGGLWLHVDYGGAFSSDAPAANVANKLTSEALAGFVAAAAGTYRRDIIQARITDTDDATTPRDSEDAVTRALTTQNPVKRSRLAVEYQRKAGIQQASQALADDPANEAAADAGWFKTGSVLVDQGGTMDSSNIWDWRKPWGYSRGLSTARDFYSDQGHLTLVSSGAYAQGATADQVLVDCPLGKVMAGAAGFNQCPVRLELVSLLADFVSAPAASDVRITGWSLRNGFISHLLDAGLSVTAALAEHSLLTAATVAKPVWSNGLTNPYSFSIDPSPYSVLRQTINTVPGGTADHLYGARWQGWGGY